MLIINYLFSIAAADFVLGVPYLSSNVPFPTQDLMRFSFHFHAPENSTRSRKRA